MMYETLEQFRRRLLRRKATLLAHGEQLSAEEQELRAEREPDWEDAAAAESAAIPLIALEESERLEFEQIRRALDRMALGTYEDCAICHERIDIERLRAVPDTDRCSGCSDRDVRRQ